MKETFPGVMEMAVNTFLTISIKCKEEFVISRKSNEDGFRSNNIQDNEPYIMELIRRI